MGHIPTTLEEVLNSTRTEVINRYRTYLNPELASLLGLLGFDKMFVKAQGLKVFDDEGNGYMDFLGGYGTLNLGRDPHEVIQALEKVFDLPNIFQASMGIIAGSLAETLAKITPDDLNKIFFCNSGAEAVDGALKLARISTGRKKILYTNNSFHGKTLGALSVTGRKYQDPFRPLVPECYSVPFGDGEALVGELKKGDYAAFIVEPIQGRAVLLYLLKDI